MSYFKNINIQASDTPSIDAFGRWRVSNPETIFDSKQIFDNQPLFWDDQETSGGGTGSSHSAANATTTLSVSASTAGTRVRQTFRRFNYQPGKSQLCLFTTKMNTLAAGITGRVGLFDANNGIFFEANGTTLRVVRRTSVTGSPVDNAVAQSSWNIDKMDGTGASGITIDPTKTQILWIDYEWLGVGRIRMGFVVDGIFYPCHEFLNTNSLATVYMSTPNLPIRYELSNDGTGGAATLAHICSSVMSEGGSQDTGIVRYRSTSGVHLDAATENTIYALIGIRLKAAALGATVKLLSATLQMHTATSKAEWILKFNPTVANTFTFADQTNSAVQTVLGGSTNTVTGGTDIAGGFLETGGVASGAAGSVSADIENALLLGSKIDGTADTIVLCVRPIAGSTDIDVEGAITWRELS